MESWFVVKFLGQQLWEQMTQAVHIGVVLENRESDKNQGSAKPKLIKGSLLVTYLYLPSPIS